MESKRGSKRGRRRRKSWFLPDKLAALEQAEELGGDAAGVLPRAAHEQQAHALRQLQLLLR